MHFFLETLRFFGLLIYFILESFILLFIPIRKKNVAGEIVLITGAGCGMGRLLALKFARLGATLVLWDVNVEGNKETARLARESGARVHAYTCDCSKRQEVYKVADQVISFMQMAFVLSNLSFKQTSANFIAKSQCPQASNRRNYGWKLFHVHVNECSEMKQYFSSHPHPSDD